MEGFKVLSELWLKQEWNLCHWQSFSWLGYQIWQLPEDIFRLQEVIFDLKPDVILETGVKHGGSSIFFASLCQLLGRGRVISIDIQIPEAVNVHLQSSPLARLITLIEGNSVDPKIIERVKGLIAPDEKVLVFLDSDHSKRHVLAELEAYADLVPEGYYLIVTDGVMELLASTPRGRSEWVEDNPSAAARQFAAEHPEFELSRPRAKFNNESVVEGLTFWPDAWLKRTTSPS